MNRLKKHLGKIAIGFLFVLFSAGIALGTMAYFALENRLEVARAENLQYQAQLQQSLADAQQQAALATAASQQTQSSLETEQQLNADLAKDLATTRQESSAQVADLQNQLLAISNSTSVDNSDLVAEWEPRVGKVSCLGNNGGTWSGSATAFLGQHGGIFALTNYHVLSGASQCWVAFPGDNQYYTIAASDMGWDSSPYDWAYFTIDSPTSYLLSHAAAWSFCADNSLELGDQIVILGYPGDGATSTVTVTQGIVSGRDDEFYVTDGKIDHGNSGGAAIAVQGDCFAGIPTAATVGAIESYGKILDINKIF